MPPVRFYGSMGQKKRSAVRKFVKLVNQQVSLPVPPTAMSGPSGGIVVYCGISGATDRLERAARAAMSQASQEVLTTENEWVVGVPQRTK
jgi:hypothetical protein